MSDILHHPIGEFFDLSNQISSSSSVNHKSSLKSYVWSSERCRKIRFCEFTVENKFYAESLVIYPDFCYDIPIFGTEYLKIGSKRYFAAIDFHPITENKQYLKFMEMFPDKKRIKTHVYDLDRFFSEKLWIRRRTQDFYDEYQIMLKCFLHQYKKCLYSVEQNTITLEQQQSQYNDYMSTNDPAHGILKSYFGEDFAKQYIDDFLFSNK